MTASSEQGKYENLPRSNFARLLPLRKARSAAVQADQQTAAANAARQAAIGRWLKKGGLLILLGVALFFAAQFYANEPGPPCAPNCAYADLSAGEFPGASSRGTTFYAADFTRRQLFRSRPLPD